MARFSFRLQTYLSVKEQIEEQKKNEYGRALRKLERERQKKRLMEQELFENIQLFKNGLARAVVPGDIRRYNSRIELLKVQIAEQELRIKEAERRAEEKRLDLIEAMKERKALETVKERNHEEFLKEEQRVEQTVSDGIVSYQYAKKDR